jgi:hypothetical protein
MFKTLISDDSKPSSFNIFLFESPKATDSVQDNLTTSTQQSHSQQTKFASASKEISRILWQPKFYYR